jgi:hypothetical protein
MKKLITFLVVAALMVAPIGCGGGPGSSGDNPSGDGTPVETGGKTKAAPGDADPKTGKVMSDADILKNMGEGGSADPASAAGGGKK